jgi:hypothetical protein
MYAIAVDLFSQLFDGDGCQCVRFDWVANLQRGSMRLSTV